MSSALGEYAPEHDVPAITDALYSTEHRWDVSRVDHDRFWSVEPVPLAPLGRVGPGRVRD